jgi:ribosomal protein L12E/L44/L45/RPP1/RPP2
MATADLATSYAALILADQGLNITADKIQTLVKTAHIDNVPPIHASVIANALKGKDAKNLLLGKDVFARVDAFFHSAHAYLRGVPVKAVCTHRVCDMPSLIQYHYVDSCCV